MKYLHASNDYAFDHSFNGKLVYVPDTQENRFRHPYYFENNYHHYIFYCYTAYKFTKNPSVHLYVHERLPGKEGSSSLEEAMRIEDRTNVPLDMVEIYNPTNKQLSYHLLKFQED